MKISFSFPLVASLVVCSALAAGYAFTLYRIDTSVARIEGAIASAEALTKKDVLLQSIEVLLRETEPLRASLAGTVVLKNNTVDVIQLLEDVSRDTGADLSIANIVDNRNPGWQHHEQIAVVFSLNGTFAAHAEFLAVVESLPFAARIEQGTMEKSGDRTWFGSYTATFVKEKL